MKTIVAMGVAAALMVGVSSGARAEEPEGWQFEVAPYGWFAGLAGKTTVGGQSSEFKKSTSDLFEALEFGGSILGVAQYNRTVLLAQYDFFAMSSSKLDPADQPANSTMDSDIAIGKVGIGYQYGDAEATTVDVLLAVQSVRMKNTLAVTGAGSSSDTLDMFDPVLVVRTVTPVLPSKLTGLYFNMPISLGAWLGDSDLVYDLEAQLQYRFNDTVDARVGYRIEGYEFKKNDNAKVDVALAGWTLGVGFRF